MHRALRLIRPLTNQLFVDHGLVNKTSVSLVRAYSSSSSEKSKKGVLHINLMDENDKVLFGCTLDEAKRYAKKHNLLLVNYEGPNKTPKNKQMQVLPMGSGEESAAASEGVQSSSKKKSTKGDQNVKKYYLKESITDHDLDIKLKQMALYLSKGFKIRLIINGFKMEQKMGVLDKIKKKFVPHLAFKQVSTSSSQIKLFIVPDKTFLEFYEQNFKKDEHLVSQTEDNEDEDGLFDDDELEKMIDEKVK